ncbi:MAG TPA: wax ester/triacylglycerol synthase domain-containing protein, partial [Acidimicrobiales bacterium]
PFDRSRPLWEYVIVDGLDGGRGALIQKMHHTIGDGEAGVRLSLQFLDRKRNDPEPPPLEAPPRVEAPPADRFDGLRDLLLNSFKLPLGMARQAMELATRPARIPEATAATVSSMKGLVTTLSDTSKARSPLWTERSMRRHLETLRAPLEPTKVAAKAMGGTLNGAFLAAAAAAAGAYHRELGTPVDSLRASMAISTRTSSSGANAFSLARMEVPTGEMPMRDRLQAITAATQGARQTSGSASMELLATVAASLPVSVVARIAKAEAQTIDFATSNVRGAPMPLYLAGAKILENYPIGPLAGVAFNLTLLSYNGSLDMGLHVDPAAITEPALLTRLMEDAFVEMRDSV